MKSILTIFLVVTVLTTTFAQTKDIKKAEKPKSKRIISGQHLELRDNEGLLLLSENVRFELGDLYVESDSLIFVEKDQSLIAYNIKRFTFNGEVILSQQIKSQNNILRYRLNDKRVFLE